MRDRLPQAQRRRVAAGDQTLPPADRAQADDGDGDRAAKQDEHLDHVGIEHRPQAAPYRVGAGGDDDDHRAGPEIDAHQRLENNTAGGDGHRNLGQDIADNGNDGEIESRTAGIAALEEFGHRENAGADIERHEKPAQQQQNESGQDFELGDGDPGCCAGARQADQMLRTDIGRKQRGADDKPADIAPGKEEILGVIVPLPQAGPDGDAENDDEIQGQHGPVIYAHESVLPGSVAPVRIADPLATFL